MYSILLATVLASTPVYDRDNNQRIRAEVGETIEIRLLIPEGEHSGWSITHVDLGVLKPSRPQVAPKRRTDPPDTEVQVFRIQVLDQARTTIRLRYQSPNNKRYKPTNRTFVLNIN